MGCRLSKDDTKSSVPSENQNNVTMARDQDHGVDYKARLERKMCLAKETPEPDFDLSECNLKEVPAGVFVLCRVLRKEHLDLSRNKIADFVSGPLSDLSLLRILNLKQNKIKKLPDDVSRLENLRELLLSDNLLTQLPTTINRLHQLELLDVSNNKIEHIEEINCMPALQILNLSGNIRLRQLPTTLSTCDNLRDVILDEDQIDWPPPPVIAAGVENILKFLTTGDYKLDHVDIGREAKEMPASNEDALLKKLAEREAKRYETNKTSKYLPDCNDGYGNENALIEQLQIRQMKQKQELLQAVLLQQSENEYLVNKVQLQKDHERDILIKDIKEAEENANIVIEKLLALRIGPDPTLLEKERLEEERLLEKLHLEHSELRKQEILTTMLDVLHNEDNKLLDYQQKRNLTSKDILERELESSKQLKDFFLSYEKSRNDVILRICEDEELQKRAVARLIEMNDARTWGLVEQLKIVEAQLANITQFEIEKKKFSSIEQMNELTEKRIRLTFVLTDLLDQKESRKRELLDTLTTMEAQKLNEEDFWLLQYQRLIDSRPLDFNLKCKSLDPLLGYNFLVNGVIHCLPFLQKLWKNIDYPIENINEDTLLTCGIKNEKDRKLILKSISDFLNENKANNAWQPRIAEAATAPTEGMSSIPTENNVSQNSDENGDTLSECVVCMERTVQFIFIPCGHMCCCEQCQQNLILCPMCRTSIDRKIKVIQP